jgi:phage tail P2-like protein
MSERFDSRIIQPSIAQDERTQALWQLINGLENLPIERAIIYDIDQVVSSAIPSLIRQFSAQEFVVPGMTEAEYRELIWRSIELHRYKGTLHAVRRALGILGITSVLVSEWWQSTPKRQVHTFRVAIDGEGLPAGDPRFDVSSPDFWSRAYRLVEAAKPARSGFEIAIASRPRAPISRLGASKRVSAVLQILAAVPSRPTVIALGAKIAASKRLTSVMRVNAGIPRPKAKLAIGGSKRITVKLAVSTPKIPTVVSTQSGLRLGFQSGERISLDLPVTGSS